MSYQIEKECVNLPPGGYWFSFSAYPCSGITQLHKDGLPNEMRVWHSATLKAAVLIASRPNTSNFFNGSITMKLFGISACASPARKLILAVVFGLLAVALVPRTVREQSLDRIERERVDQMLQRLKDDLHSHYYDPNYHGLDLDARFTAAREKLKQATTLGQALGIAAQTLLDFDDSHTFFLPPSRPGIVDYGWEMQMIGDNATSWPWRLRATQKVGLKPGDLVISVKTSNPSERTFGK